MSAVLALLGGAAAYAIFFAGLESMERRAWERRFHPKPPVPFWESRRVFPFAVAAGATTGALIFPPAVFGMVFGAASAITGVFLFRRERTEKEKAAYLRELPDFLDLMALGVSAGLQIERAWGTALAYAPTGRLTRLLRAWVRTLDAGGSRREAFGDLEQALKQPRLAAVFALIQQSLESGHPVQDVLRDQAAFLREHQFLALEESAQTAGLRLLFPIFLFIFPTVFLVLLAPLAIRYSQGVAVLF